jgi:hypothetical protein
METELEKFRREWKKEVHEKGIRSPNAIEGTPRALELFINASQEEVFAN